MALLEKGLKSRLGAGTVVADAVGAAETHATFECRKQVMDLAQKGDGLDVLAHRCWASAETLLEGPNDGFACAGDGVVGSGHAPGVNGLPVIGVNGHDAVTGVGQCLTTITLAG